MLIGIMIHYDIVLFTLGLVLQEKEGRQDAERVAAMQRARLLREATQQKQQQEVHDAILMRQVCLSPMLPLLPNR